MRHIIAEVSERSVTCFLIICGVQSLKVLPRGIVTAVLNVVSPLPFTLESSVSGEMRKIVNMFKIHLSSAFLPQPP